MEHKKSSVLLRLLNEGVDFKDDVEFFENNSKARITEKVELRTTLNPWKTFKRMDTSNLTKEEFEKIKFYRKVMSILNKLTHEKCTPLVNQILQFPINCEEVLNIVVKMICEKAVDEPLYSNTYANMCKQLLMYKVKIEGSESKTVNLRKLLLTRCQRTFENVNKELDDKINEMLIECVLEGDEGQRQLIQEEIDKLKFKVRKRSLGNIRFIGELYKLNILTAPIMHYYLKKWHIRAEDDSLEYFAHLIFIAGKQLAKETMSKEYLKQDNMQTYFWEIREIISSNKVCTRIKFLLIDLIDFMENDYNIERITTPASNHLEALAAESDMQSDQKRMYDRKMKGGRNFQNTSEDRWITNRSKNRDYMCIVDTSKKLTKLIPESDMKFRPTEMLSAWGRGTSEGSKAVSSKPEKSAPFQKRFSALTSNEAYTDHRRADQRSAATSRESNWNVNRQLTPQGTRKSVLQSQKLHAHHVDRFRKKKESMLKRTVISEEELEKKGKAFFEEYLSAEDINEAVLCVGELAHPNIIHLLLSFGIQYALDKTSKDRKLVGKLIVELMSRKMISMEDYKKSLEEVLHLAEDFAIDVPKVFEYLGEIIAPVLLQGDISAIFLKELMSPYAGTPTARDIMLGLIQTAQKENRKLVKSKWSRAGLQWSYFLSPDDNIKDFVTKHKLEYLEGPSEQHRIKILELLRSSKSNNEILEWIHKNVEDADTKQPFFIRALVTAVIESAIEGSGFNNKLNPDKLKSRVSVLSKYIDYSESLELEALYAIQALLNKLGHPRGLINIIFESIFENEIVSEDAFTQWETNSNPAEFQGRDAALKNSAIFREWIKKDVDI